MIGLGTAAKVAGNVATTISDNKIEAAKIKIALQSELMKAQTNIITAEASGGAMQRNWRPALMWLIITIIGYNYLLQPIFNDILSLFSQVELASLELPDKLWNLMTIGLGGYVGGRTFEKIKQQEQSSKSTRKSAFWPHQHRGVEK